MSVDVCRRVSCLEIQWSKWPRHSRSVDFRLPFVDSWQGQWITDAHHAAFALDPRVRSSFHAAEDDGRAWSEQRELWQASVVRARRWVAGYVSVYPDRAAALNAAFDEYVAWKGQFAECPLPAADADILRAIAWWRSEQPSLVLGQVAEHLFCMRASQGAAERAWAALSRQSTPIRARLSVARKRQILNVVYNGRMAITGQASSVQSAKRMRRGRSDDSLPVGEACRSGAAVQT